MFFALCRVDPFSEDPKAYGYNSRVEVGAPVTPAAAAPQAKVPKFLRHCASAPQLCSSPATSSFSSRSSDAYSFDSDLSSSSSSSSQQAGGGKRLRRLAFVALASGVAVLVGRQGAGLSVSSRRDRHRLHKAGHRQEGQRRPSHDGGHRHGVHVHRHHGPAVHLANGEQSQRRQPLRSIVESHRLQE